MNLQTIKSQDTGGWNWARTGALILFLITGILFVVSLRTDDGRQQPTAFAKGFVSSALGKAS